MNLNVFLLYYWHTADNSMMRGCNYRVSLFTKYDFIEQCFIFVTWSDRRLGQSDQQCCHHVRVIIIIMIEYSKQTTASRPYNRECININWLNPSQSVIYIIQDQFRTTSCYDIWILVKQKEDSMHWQKIKYIFCSGKRNEIFCSFDCNLKLFFQCFRSASFSN